VLVVEDDEGMRAAIERLMCAAGLDCHTYSSAEALLEAGAADDADCVISDMRLPGMSGLELLSRLRERASAAPLILITAHDNEALRDRAGREGATACLAKPFRGTALLAAVESAIATTNTRVPRAEPFP
jgi:FixJ family two-component response regulator